MNIEQVDSVCKMSEFLKHYYSANLRGLRTVDVTSHDAVNQ